MNAAAEKASEAAVKSSIKKASAALGRTSALETPPPPPVPEFQSLSVMVAVNGQTYGPYERATLTEMIDKGSLTRETFVFINGMSDWKKAGEVEAVAALFSSPLPPAPAPPAPWANAHTEQYENQDYDNTLSARLNQLIKAAVADGEISDLERQVLIRNAQEEGVAMDEFVMVLEAKLYEQRQMLQTKKEQRDIQSGLAQAKMKASLNMGNSGTSSERKINAIRKCPACGAVINSTSMVKCPECGYELDLANEESDAVQQLINKLDEIDQEFQGLSAWQQAMKGSMTYTKRKAAAILAFVPPRSRKGMMDFMTIACSLSSSTNLFDPTRKAWKQKVKEVIVRSSSMYSEDAEFQSMVQSTADSFNIKL